MHETQPNNPLHGVTLEQLLHELVAFHGWDGLGRKIGIRCFTHDPSITPTSSFCAVPHGLGRVWNRCLSKGYKAGVKR